jgi:hypothetical protein
MAIRQSVRDLAALGPLPSSDEATPEAVDQWHDRLTAITRPVNEQEALILLTLFGPDDCFGVAWTLLHLIETCPSGVPPYSKPSADANEWVQLLWESSHREWL